MTPKNDVPTQAENEEQLRRILASSTFAKLPVLSPLLLRLVNDNLKGTAGGKEYEITLAVEVFGKNPKKWTPDQNDVRQGVVNLRKQLRAYYSAEGSGDTIEVSFPPRSGFAPRFAYRRISNAEEVVQGLADAFRYSFPDIEQCTRIVQDLEDCIAEHPAYAPAYGILSEAILACVLCDATHAFPLPQALLRAEEAVNTGMQLNKAIWRLHVMAGAIHCCRFEWSNANAAFKSALYLARYETVAHFWYVAFLFATGRTAEVLQCVVESEECAAFRHERPWLRIGCYLRPLILYVEHKILDAHLAFPLEWSIGPRLGRIGPRCHWLVEILLACMSLADGGGASAVQHADAGVLQSKVGAFTGLLVLSRMTQPSGKQHEKNRALALLAKMERDELRKESPVSLALAYIGIEKPDAAVTQLEKACDIGHPLMIWLHLWPVFDPLRENDRFKALIKKMNLP